MLVLVPVRSIVMFFVDLVLSRFEELAPTPKSAETDCWVSDSERANGRGGHTPLHITGHASSDKAQFAGARIKR